MINYKKDYYWEDKNHLISSDNEVRLSVFDREVWNSDTGDFVGTMLDDWILIDEMTGDIYDVYPY